MKVKIDSKKISSGSKLINDETTSDIEVNETIQQLRQQLLFGNNSCFLISGYRGTGKTTIIHQLESEIKNENIIFVHLNFSKYQSHSLVLRKLIREIYLTLSSRKIYKEIKDKELVSNIELLYEHTFHEVYSSSNVKKIKELTGKLEGNVDLKDMSKNLFPIIPLVFSSLDIFFGFIPSFSIILNLIILIVSICWLVINIFKIKIEFQKKYATIEELNRKSLYDDEIAEYHLNYILERLKKEGIKIIFVFDELDKIENEDEMIKIISDLKPLLLSDLASFIVISGQKLYYKFIMSSVLDDSIMTSIFSKNIHIPLSANISLEKLFNSYVINTEDLNNELVIKYRDSLILDSYKTIRRFINLVLENIIWEANIAYLHIDENDEHSYNTDSIILKTLMEIIEKEIDDIDYDDGIKDFLTYQLFIWIKKMKFKGSAYFTSNDIFNFEEDYSEMYPTWCKLQLSELCNKLIKTLLSINLLEKKEIHSEGEIDNEIYYKWTSGASIKVDNIGNSSYENQIKFLENMIELEKYCRYIYINLEKNISESERTKSLMNIIKYFINIRVIKDRWIDNRFKELYQLSSKIRHGETLTIKEIDEIIKSKNDIKALIYDLLEGYCFYVVSNYLKRFDYTTFEDKSQIDICAENDSMSNILFEIKYTSGFGSRVRDLGYRLIRSLEEYNKCTKKQNKLVVFWFSMNGKNSFNMFEREFNRIVINEYNELYNDVYLFDLSLDKDNFSIIKMEAYLNEVISPILNNDSMGEIAVTREVNIYNE